MRVKCICETEIESLQCRFSSRLEFVIDDIMFIEVKFKPLFMNTILTIWMALG